MLKKIKSELKNIYYKKIYDKPLPSNLILLITNPRSGSTWLTDIIRFNSNVKMIENAVIYSLLDLDGRRYQRDLSKHIKLSKPNFKKIEVRPGTWEKIPIFNKTKNNLNYNYAIEKIHPEFFDFDSNNFLKRIKEVENNDVNIKFIFHLRDPRASITSFIKYKSRNHNWYSGFDSKDVFYYMANTYKQIFKMYKSNNGIIIDYIDLKKNFNQTSKKIYSYLWPEYDEDYFEQIVKDAFEATSRNKRVSSSSDFFGEKEGKIKGNPIEFNKLFKKYNSDLKKCYKYYNLLIEDRI